LGKVKYFQSSPRVKIKYKDSDQTHLALGVQAFDRFDERRHALNLLSIILGGNTSSRLFMEIREKLGAAYYIGARAGLSSYGGELVANAGIPHGELKRVIRKITGIFKKLQSKVTEINELEQQYISL